MFDLYNSVSIECSKVVTKRYSTSFSLAIKTLHKNLHDPIYSIYGFVRIADEIVDSFHNFDKKKLLDEFKSETYKAIQEGISTNPILHSFQDVVNKYKIDFHLIDAFLKSMEMDLYKNKCNDEDYKEYIYGSAEVVGLMCLKVFCNGDNVEYEKLKEPARRLGSAFQKVNFIRDLKSDYADLGRVYFPNTDFNKFTSETKKEIEKDIEEDFNEAYKGILNLPEKAKMGVYLAYIYYKALFSKIKALPANKIMSERVRVPDNQKIFLMIQSYFKYRFNFI